MADDGRHLFMHRGFVVQDTERERKELGQVPQDDIAAVIANAHGLSYELWLELRLLHSVDELEARRLGYELWPELHRANTMSAVQV